MSERQQAVETAEGGGGTRDRVYLDHNATSPLRPEARDAMLAVLDAPGNPSSVHQEGRGARAVVERARGAVAALVGGASRSVVFTSGATEAVALALHPEVEIDGRPHLCDVLLASAVEHPAVLKGHRFPRVERVPVDVAGRVDLDALEERLRHHRDSGRRAMVALMAANNETGVLQPLEQAAHLVHAYDGVIFCDAVQAAGRVPLDMADLDIDFMALSAHKLGGPQGAGALVGLRPDFRVAPLVAGGGQERNRRAGTENVAAIAGFGAAAEVAALHADVVRLRSARDRLEDEVLAGISGASVIGAAVERVPNTALIAFSGLRAETLVIALDLAHISVSAGSACSSGKVGPSHVLQAMGLDAERAAGAIRLSLGWSSRDEDVDRAVEALQKVVPQVRGRSPQAA
ncbi:MULTISPECIES: cysteine desulfurase family protein [Xanthobacter]|uniref:cysteine desulfurase family protein n=1 Tax=Xanthobacter TaxID=279 RepID=UPI001F2852B6|nr:MULTISPECIES: cysteine desulfurase family protein [unclassified Xanthobacter]